MKLYTRTEYVKLGKSWTGMHSAYSRNMGNETVRIHKTVHGLGIHQTNFYSNVSANMKAKYKFVWSLVKNADQFFWQNQFKSKNLIQVYDRTFKLNTKFCWHRFLRAHFKLLNHFYIYKGI
jgi:hypothetical protein